MELGKIGSIFIRALEPYALGNEIGTTVQLKEKYIPGCLFPAYRKLILENPQLQSKWREDLDNNVCQWERFDQTELESLLQHEKDRLTKKYTKTEAFNEYHPTNTRLPFRISRIDDQTLYFAMNHMLGHVGDALLWISKWFEAYAQETAQPLGSNLRPPKKRTNKIRRTALLWSLAYVLRFIRRAKRDGFSKTVDLSHGQIPEPNQHGYLIESYLLDQLQTKRLTQLAQEQRITVGQLIERALCQALFETSPEKDRVAIVMPVDYQGKQQSAIGSWVGNFPLQVYRHDVLAVQIKEEHLWLKRGVPYWIVKLLGILHRQPSGLMTYFKELYAKPSCDRGLLAFMSWALSNVGLVEDPLLEHFAQSISSAAKMLRPLSLVVTFKGQMTIELSVPLSLCDQEQARSVMDVFIEKLATREFL
jgi:hypothetical protein